MRGVGVHDCTWVCATECISLVVAVTAGRDRRDWHLPVAVFALGDAAGLLQLLSARGPLPSRTGWGTSRIKLGVEAGFVEGSCGPAAGAKAAGRRSTCWECLFLSPALAAVSCLQVGEGSAALTCGIVLVERTFLRTGNFA